MTLFAAPPAVGTMKRYACAKGFLNAIRPAYKQDEQTWGPPRSAIIAWVGGSYDAKRNRTWIHRGGGHNDGGQNDTQGFDWQSTGDWLAPFLDGTDPTVAGAFPVDSPLCPSHTSRIPATSSQPAIQIYADGKPAARHTCFGVRYCPTEDKIWTWGGSAYGTQPAPDRSVFVWDPTVAPTAPGLGMWKRAADSPHDPSNGAANVYRAQSGEVVAVNPQGELCAHKLSTDTWRRYTGWLQPADYSTALALDPGRDVALWLGGGQAYAIDLSKPTLTAASCVDVKAKLPAELIATGLMGLDFAPQIDSFVAWIGGRKLYLVKSGTWEGTVVTLTGDDPGAIYDNVQTMRGCFGRFHVFPAAVAGDTGQQVTVGLIMHLDAVYMARFTGSGTPLPTTAPPLPTTAPPLPTTAPPGTFTETVIGVPYVKANLLVADAPVVYKGAVYDVAHVKLSEQSSSVKMLEYVFRDADLGRAPKVGDYFKTWQEKAGGVAIGGSLSGLMPIDGAPPLPTTAPPLPTTAPPSQSYDVVDSTGVVGKLTMYRR